MMYIIFSTFFLVSCVYGGSDKIRLEDVPVITLHSGRMTTSRRTTPIPQLRCIGGSAGCEAFTPYTVQCYNRGSDGFDIQWECKTDMDNDYRFGKVEVLCEGYDNPNDKYILRGSCGLEYTIDLTESGKRRYSGGSGQRDSHSYGSYDYNTPHHTKTNTSWFGSAFSNLFGLIPIIGLIALLYFFCIHPSTNINDRSEGPLPTAPPQPPPPGFRDDFGAPPPDYNSACGGSDSSRAYRRPGGNVYTDISGFGAPTAPPPYGSRTETRAPPDASTWTPGFWTGTVLGGLGGWLFGGGGRQRRGYNYHNSYNQGMPSGGGGWFGSGGGGGGGWFGSGYSGGNYGANYGGMPSPGAGGFGGGGGFSARRSSPSPSTSSGSSGTRTASGFGGTRRR